MELIDIEKCQKEMKIIQLKITPDEYNRTMDKFFDTRENEFKECDEVLSGWCYLGRMEQLGSSINWKEFYDIYGKQLTTVIDFFKQQNPNYF